MQWSLRGSVTSLVLVGMAALPPLAACSDSTAEPADAGAGADTGPLGDSAVVEDTGVPDAAADSGGDGSPAFDAGGGLVGAASLSLGIEYSCARMTDGTARCWGENKSATLGDGTTTERTTSVPVSDTDGVGPLANVTQLAASYRRRTCALTTTAQVLCWGNLTGVGPFPDGTPATIQLLPAPAAGLTAVAQVQVGLASTCARMTDGTVQCAGRNGFGELGDGTTTARDALAPVLVAPGGAALAGVAQIAVGHHFACARMNDGTVQCWGSHQNGQLGDGTTPGVSAQSTSPVVVSGLTGVLELVAGHRHACARSSDGAVRCWGANSTGQLGDGQTIAFNSGQSTPVVVTGLTGVAQLAIEGDGMSATTCARMTDGSARCWGSNYKGQVGDGTMMDRTAPTAVKAPGGAAALTGVTDIAVGGIHACAVIAGGQVVCWGRNAHGQLGDNTIAASSLLPVSVR